eukprot:9379167-Alexandrium_andersonii.AAC.1
MNVQHLEPPVLEALNQGHHARARGNVITTSCHRGVACNAKCPGQRPRPTHLPWPLCRATDPHAVPGYRSRQAWMAMQPTRP